MSTTGDEQATSTNTVSIMVGSYLNMDQMISSGVVPSLVANGTIGLDALEYDMAYVTYRSSYENNLVTLLASAWSGSGSGTQEMSEYGGISSGTLTLTNTTDADIDVAAQGALFTATDGRTYETEEQPTNAAWSNGTSQTGCGYYIITPGQSITVAIEATFQGDDPASDPAGSITTSAITGLVVKQATALAPGSSYTDPEDNNSSNWLTTDFGDYSFVFTDQGLAPAEGHVNVNASISWTPTDVASWDGYVDNARSVGILNVAPLESDALPSEDPTQPFATSAFYAGMRTAALYGGGIEIEEPSFYWFSESTSEQMTIIEEIRWANANGLRSSLLIDDQVDFAGDPDPNFVADTVAMLKQLQAENALPSQIVLENDNTTDTGAYYYDADSSDTTSLNAVALTLADEFSFEPTASEDGLEVKGTSTAQTTLIMSGVAPSEDLASGALAPYAGTQIFSEDPAAMLTLTVSDTAGMLSLGDSLDGAATGAGGTLSFTGTAAAATGFLADLTATAASGTVGVAALTLTLTDHLGQTTAGVTSVYVGHVHPVFTAVTETGSNGGTTVHTGDIVTFTLATSAPVSVAGAPTLLLTNGRIATYAGQDGGGLLFSYTVAGGDDTASLRVRGLRLEGASITDSSSGLVINPDSIDAPEEAIASPLAVDTRTDAITTVTETGSAAGTLAAGDQVTFLLSAANPIASVTGTPTLMLNDGGIATYAGLTGAGALAFTYAVPTGGASAGLAPASSDLGAVTLTNDLGEPVELPYTLPAPATAIAYNATDTSGDPDTLVVALSADEYLGDAQAVITVNGQQVGPAIDVAAVHAAGQTQLVTITGDFGTGIDQLGISFTNDFWAGTPITDRNLYIDGVELDGVSELTPTELDETSTLTTPISTVKQDELQLWVNEDAAGSGDAMFSVTVDGKLLPDTYATDVSHASGEWQEVDIFGDFGAGPHTVATTFLNDAWIDGADRNLYLNKVAIDGMSATPAQQELLATGSTAAVTLPSQAEDVLTLDVSEDAWHGDAQCYVTIDGKIMGGITTVTATHAAGEDQTITVDDAGLSVGTHTIGLSFINDAWGGTDSTDRNLYLDGVQLNGVDQGLSAAIRTWGTASFKIGPLASHVPVISNITSLITGAAAQIAIGTAAQTKSASSLASNLNDLHVSQSTIGAVAASFG